MDHFPGGADRAERPGSLIEGVIVGLALEVGAASTVALAASQVRHLAWSPPIAPVGLLLVSALAFAMVAGFCVEPGGRPLARLAGRVVRRIRAIRPRPSD